MSREQRQCDECGKWQSRSNSTRHVRGCRERRVGAPGETDLAGDIGDPGKGMR